jgi:hypothetical protein
MDREGKIDMDSDNAKTDGASGGVAGSTHTGDLPDVRDNGAADQAPRERGPDVHDFKRLEAAFIDRVFGGSRKNYEADYPRPSDSND